MSRPYYVTTPIYYVNDKPHIGHAYTSIAADVMARFHSLEKCPVTFITGTDEHGQKVAKAAQQKGMDPKAFCDEVSQSFVALSHAMHLSNNDFIRTTQPRHVKAAQALWQRMVDRGHIYKGSYAGWYALRDEAYYTEDELVDGKAPTGAEVEWLVEESYFFDLSKWQEPLLAFYEKNPSFIMPKERRNEVLSFVKSGLRDLSVSRSTFSWGVPVPGDEAHVMYVWVDALTNYLTALGFPDNTPALESFWPQAIHLVGKDILRFHAVYWPAFLMAADLPLPKQVFAHGWWTVDGQKMSKSLKNTVDPMMLADRVGVDGLRYFLLRETSFGQDGNFSMKNLVERYNADLANTLGNLCQRVLSFIHKTLGPRVPQQGVMTPEDHALCQGARDLVKDQRKHAETLAPHKMLESLWGLISACNRYVDTQAPWALKKTDPQRMETVLFVLVDVLRYIGLYGWPFMPQTFDKLLDMLHVPRAQRFFEALPPLVPGQDLGTPEPLFPRLVDPEQDDVKG